MQNMTKSMVCLYKNKKDIKWKHPDIDMIGTRNEALLRNS